MSSKGLVTGVPGFIGSDLADHLPDVGREVVGIDNRANSIREQIHHAVESYPADIRSERIHRFFQGVDVIFYLAAKDDLIACQRKLVETTQINIAGTSSLFGP